MKKETRTVVYDDELRMEAYRFEGIVQPFPSHFHEHYVIGFVENGERVLSCRDREYAIEEGSIVLFNPGDSHACVQSGEGTFDYRGFNISKEIMLDLAEEVTGKQELPGFSKSVVCDEEIACHLRSFYLLFFPASCKISSFFRFMSFISYHLICHSINLSISLHRKPVLPPGCVSANGAPDQPLPHLNTRLQEY